MKIRPLVGFFDRTVKFAMNARPRGVAIAALFCAASLAIAAPPTEILLEGPGAGGAIASIQTISISDGLTLTVSAKLDNGSLGLFTRTTGIGWRTPFVSDELGLTARGEIFEAAGSGTGSLTAFSAGIYNRPGVLGPTVPGIIDSAWTATNSQTLFTGAVELGMRGESLPVPYSSFWYSLSNVQLSVAGIATWLGTTSTNSDGLPSHWGIYRRLSGTELDVVMAGGGSASTGSATYVIDNGSWPRNYRMSAAGTHAAIVCSVLDGTVSKRAVITRDLASSAANVAAIVGTPISLETAAPKWKDISFAIPSDEGRCAGTGKLLIVGKVAATQFDDSVVVVNGQIVLREGATIGGWVLHGNVFDASMNSAGDWAAVWQVHSATNEENHSTVLIVNGEIVLMPGVATISVPPLTVPNTLGALTADVEVGASTPGDPVPVFIIAKIGNTRAVLQVDGPLANACCAADFNNDFIADFFDYLDFMDVFSAGDPTADFNLDGEIDFFDYLDFVNAFSVGC